MYFKIKNCDITIEYIFLTFYLILITDFIKLQNNKYCEKNKIFIILFLVVLFNILYQKNKEFISTSNFSVLKHKRIY